MKFSFHNKKLFKLRIKIEFIFIFLVIFTYILAKSNYHKKEDIKIALCTMGRRENLYVKEFIEYYNKLGIDHIFIYDDFEFNSESIFNFIDKKYLHKVTTYNLKQNNINGQIEAFSDCYKKNNNKYDWFLMVDMDEFLYIVKDNLKSYLTKKIFNKCDFIKLHWVLPTDNGLIYYDYRPLFERFKPPYFKSVFIKSIIRGNISDLKYWVHSPYFSPKRNVTCNNIGKRIYYKNLNFETFRPINIKKAYIIHFMFKSTEEFINKLKRGYRHWYGNITKNELIEKLKFYFIYNKATFEKIKFIDEELDLNLSGIIKY